MSSNRLMRLLIHPDVLMELFKNGRHSFGIEGGLPKDAVCSGANWDWDRNCLCLTVHSGDFAELGENEVIPIHESPVVVGLI